MMSVLDALRYRLGGGESDDPALDPALSAMLGLPKLPSGLPLNVQDSILYRPSYAEGDIKAPLPYWNPALDSERHLYAGPQRSDPLSDELAFNRLLKEEGTGPIGERQTGYLTHRPPEQSLFASPLNQFLQQLPGWGGLGPNVPGALLSMY
jgi:hypothetical protein